MLHLSGDANLLMIKYVKTDFFNYLLLQHINAVLGMILSNRWIGIKSETLNIDFECVKYISYKSLRHGKISVKVDF